MGLFPDAIAGFNFFSSFGDPLLAVQTLNRIHNFSLEWYPYDLGEGWFSFGNSQASVLRKSRSQPTNLKKGKRYRGYPLGLPKRITRLFLIGHPIFSKNLSTLPFYF